LTCMDAYHLQVSSTTSSAETMSRLWAPGVWPHHVSRREFHACAQTDCRCLDALAR
jgi:hypothetical protein